MIKFKLFSVGKSKESWLKEALNEYEKRLKSEASFQFIWTKDNEQLENLVSKEPYVICLDSDGEMMNSEKFSQYLMRAVEKGGSNLSFVIGGAEGLPQTMREKYPLFSLSKMTYTHQIARLIIIEQIYRAFEIAKGTKYHK